MTKTSSRAIFEIQITFDLENLLMDISQKYLSLIFSNT